MENRIQINGVWYVREDQIAEEESIIVIPFLSTCAEYETEDYGWKAIKLYKDNGSLYSGIDIEFTDKTKTPWKEDLWDNVNWILGVHKGDADSLEKAKEEMSASGVAHFRAFLKSLDRLGWLNS